MDEERGFISGPKRSQVSPETVLLVLGVGLAMLGALYLLWQLRQIVRWCVIAAFLAVALDPIVDWLQSRRVPRAAGILLVYLALAAGLAGMAALVLPPLLAQVSALTRFVIRLFLEPQGATQTIQELANQYGLGGYVETLRAQLSTLPSRLAAAAVPLISLTRSIVGSVTSLLSILLITFFLLLDGEKFINSALSLIAPGARPTIRRLLNQSANAVSGYITGNIIISLIAGAAAFVVSRVLSMPYALALALTIAIFDLIPLIGATLGALLVVAVGLFVDPVRGGILLVYFLIYQQIENNLIQPFVYGRSVNLHPLAVFVAAVAGAQLLGILGALLAIPMAEIIRILATEWLASHRRTVQTVIAPPPRPENEAT